jgi:uncharacterized protein YbjQ (UPF0145 family)
MSDTPKDLPVGASHRLEELEHGLFTSDLSVNEFLLIKEVGFHPLGFVMGSSIYHTGIQTRKWGQSQELTKLTEAMYNARELAMTRMEEEADELGADGVVGVRLDVNYYEWGKDAAEFIAVGTAVKAESGVSHRNKAGKPFTSDLSGQDFWTLMQTGYIPQGLVMGTCVYHIAHRGLGATLGSAGQNVELPNFTQALYEARELAMNRMDAEAIELGADGVVGVRLDVNYYEWGSDTAEFIAVGTAVKAEDGRSYRNNQGKPFTSDLSGQDFWTLMQTGHVPQGLVMGTCVFHIAHRKLTQALGSMGQNVELPNFTQALYEARELAMTRMQDEANQLGASGIVGVRLEEKSHQWGSHTIEFLSLGTAVVKTSDEVTLPTPTTIISLDN